MRNKLPQIQSECALESGLKQSGFLQIDTPIKHALSEVCCATPPPLNQAQESSLLSVFAVIPHQHSCLQTCHTTSTFSFSVAHIALLLCSKQLRIHWWWNYPGARLAHVKAGESKVQSLLHCHQ